MIQIIEENKRPKAPRGPSTTDRFKNAFATAVDIGSKTFLSEHEKKQQLQKIDQENQAIKKQLGVDLTGIYDPKQRQEAVAMALQGRNQQRQAEFNAFTQGQRDRQQFENDMALQSQKYGLESNKHFEQDQEDQHRYEIIKENFGQRAADIYRAAPEGGKTEIIKNLLEASQRGSNLEDLLGTEQSTKRNSEFNEEPSSIIKAIDYDKGLTPKERVKRQGERYSINLPLYQKSQDKLQGIEYTKDALDKLSELSPQIGSIERLNINPMNGELLIPALASSEAQQFVKTVNDFTTQAKDSYGSRISNFELDRFMKRLPTLANSEQGRRDIIRQMQLLTNINEIRERSIQDVIDEHGGIRNIDYDVAERIADKISKKQINQLKSEFKSVDNRLEKEYIKNIEEKKSIVPKDHVAVQRADGSTGYIPKNKLKAFLKVPGNKAL